MCKKFKPTTLWLLLGISLSVSPTVAAAQNKNTHLARGTAFDPKKQTPTRRPRIDKENQNRLASQYDINPWNDVSQYNTNNSSGNSSSRKCMSQSSYAAQKMSSDIALNTDKKEDAPMFDRRYSSEAYDRVYQWQESNSWVSTNCFTTHAETNISLREYVHEEKKNYDTDQDKDNEEGETDEKSNNEMIVIIAGGRAPNTQFFVQEIEGLVVSIDKSISVLSVWNFRGDDRSDSCGNIYQAAIVEEIMIYSQRFTIKGFIFLITDTELLQASREKEERVRKAFEQIQWINRFVDLLNIKQTHITSTLKHSMTIAIAVSKKDNTGPAVATFNELTLTIEKDIIKYGPLSKLVSDLRIEESHMRTASTVSNALVVDWWLNSDYNINAEANLLSAIYYMHNSTAWHQAREKAQIRRDSTIYANCL